MCGLPLLLFWNVFELRLSPLFYLFFAIFVTIGSAVELGYSQKKDKKINKKIYYYCWAMTIFIPTALTVIYSVTDAEEINNAINQWTVCGLVFFLLQLSANFLEKKSFK